MRTIRSILVPVDGSQASVPAVDFAIGLAKGVGAEITFCHSVDLTGAIAQCSTPYGVTDVAPILEGLEEESKEVLATVAARAIAGAVPATTIELAGPSVSAIVDAAHERHADAIVMGTHGRRGLNRFFLGSTADGVLRRADVPVFVVSGNGANEPRAPFRRIAVAIDDSDPADLALEFALDLAQPATTSLVFVHAVDVRRLYALASAEHAMAAIAQERSAMRALLAKAAARAQERGIQSEAFILEGDPVESLLEFVRAQKVDVIAIGTHGRRGVRRLLLGSVAEGIVRASPAPVVVLRPHAKRAAQKISAGALETSAPIELDARCQPVAP